MGAHLVLHAELGCRGGGVAPADDADVARLGQLCHGVQHRLRRRGSVSDPLSFFGQKRGNVELHHPAHPHNPMFVHRFFFHAYDAVFHFYSFSIFIHPSFSIYFSHFISGSNKRTIFVLQIHSNSSSVCFSNDVFEWEQFNRGRTKAITQKMRSFFLAKSL